MLHAFIDTNVFLGFYAKTDDKIDELNRLVELIQTDQLKLYVPQCLRDEFARNRDNKLITSLNELSKTNVKPPSIPRFLDTYAETKALISAFEAVAAAHEALVAKASEEAQSRMLAADKLVASIFEAAGLIEDDARILTRARVRLELRNPPAKPGKPDSLGDRLNWEYLLASAQRDADMHIVSGDGDFASALAPTKPNQFLVQEWKTQVNGTLYLYPSIRAFLRSAFVKAPSPQSGHSTPTSAESESSAVSEIFGSEEELMAAIFNQPAAIADSLVDELVASTNFSNTHQAIAKLRPLISRLSSDDKTELLDAAKRNTQIFYILGDSDVNAFFTELLVSQKSSMSMDEYEAFLGLLTRRPQ